MAKSKAKTPPSGCSYRGGEGLLKKINTLWQQIILEKYVANYEAHYEKIKGAMLMFGDEASFGRINEPENCWAPPKERPSVPCQRIREYKTVYGAVCPENGNSFFQVFNGSNKENMSAFLRQLSERFPDQIILLVLDNAGWHLTREENSRRRRKNKGESREFKNPEKLLVPNNIRLAYIPPRTPELNPIEIIWREIRKRGFKNVMFDTLDSVIKKFIEVVDGMSNETIISITCWEWIWKVLHQVF